MPFFYDPFLQSPMLNHQAAGPNHMESPGNLLQQQNFDVQVSLRSPSPPFSPNSFCCVATVSRVTFSLWFGAENLGHVR